MTGMATPAQVERLAASTGSDFDRLFLDLMIAHHEGAVAMSTDALVEGTSVLVEEMANDVAATQEKEISQMRALLTQT